MRRTIGVAAAALLVVAACGSGEQGIVVPSDPDAPVLQLRSEGGLAPIEASLSSGPTYTLLADGRLIHQGPVIEIYPGPLLPNTQVTQATEEQMGEILDLIEAVGLPDMVAERDDSAAHTIADGTTEILTYWDAEGAHTYSVYALWMHPDPGPTTAAAIDLVEAVSEASYSGISEEYIGDRVRVTLGVSTVVPEPGFEDIRPWPLPGEDPATWEQLENGFSCTVLGPEAFEPFRDATQLTQWLHPDPMMDAPLFMLSVRALHPGEPDCPR
jgi:hypothetical protein